MILTKLSILNYKNIAQADLSFSPGINCFIGQNGEGKTNMLDAIYFLSMCRSSFSNIDSTTIRHDADFMMLQGQYEHEDGTPEEIYCGLKMGQKKVFRRGKKAYKRLAEHIGLIPLVVVSPSDSELISGGSEERRRFLDIVISQCDPAYIDALLRYNKALQQRNTLLKMEDAEPDPELLSLWEEAMAREGEYIYQRRVYYVEQLIPTFQQYYNSISSGAEQVGLRYISHCQRGPLLEVIQRDRHKDRAVGYSLHGIHKDDIEMTLGGYPIKREGSQGQNKSYLIALKLSQFDFLRRTVSNTTPILLLDDIFDKLDATRVEQIIRLVSGENFGQIFITDTNRDHLDQVLSHVQGEHKLFHVKGGTFTT
ncbi:MAG: DNA replication/repair protein RecF [Bacteroidaceae bacterium]|nr:DNA replication/repair protein RecF [Bacteroidaceae bacterium]